MIASLFKTEVFNVTWYEDHPKFGGNAKFRIFDDRGVAQIEMIDGANASVGTSPAKFCLVEFNGRKTLQVGLQTKRLSFGWGWGTLAALLLKNTGQTSELPLIVSAGPAPGLLRIDDAFAKGSEYGIGSSFSPMATQ